MQYGFIWQNDIAMKNGLLVITALLALIIPSTLLAQDDVNFEFYDGIEKGALKNTIERNASQLLTAINIAEANNEEINFNGINIENSAVQKMYAMWRNIHMRIVDDVILEHCLCIKSKTDSIIAYQVCNIKVKVIPQCDGYEGGLDQEISMVFNQQGDISDINITIGFNQIVSIWKDGKRIGDIGLRMQILYFVEQFLNAYLTKDINYIEAIYSDDVLVFNKGLKRIRERYALSEMLGACKKQYLNSVKRIFAKGGCVNIEFDSIQIVRHPTNPNIYGVTTIQNYSRTGDNGMKYTDEGTMFMIWDFTDELNPKIGVRTWHPKGDSHPVLRLMDFKF